MNLIKFLSDYLQYIIPTITFMITVIVVKPWRKTIDLNVLLFLLFIDALTFRVFFFLNFYKLIALLRFPITFSDIKTKSNRYLIPFCVLFVVIPFGFALLHVLVGNTSVFHVSILDKSSYLSLASNFINFLSIVLFSYEIQKSLNSQSKLNLNAVNILSLIIVTGVVLEFYTRFDFYYFFTGGRPLPLNELYNRPRGISFEPRGAVQALSMLLAAQLALNHKKTFYFMAPVIIWGAFLPVSFSGLVIGALVVLIYLFYCLLSFNKIGLIKVSYVIFSVFVIYECSGRDSYMKIHMNDRAYLFQGAEDSDSFLSKVANRLEISDGAYINFLDKNPIFWAIGTGIMSVNATKKWVLYKDRNFGQEYIGNPFLGVLFLHSMFGVLSLFFLFSVMSRLLNKDKWRLDADVLFNIIVMLGALTYFYVLPFIVISCFEFSKKIYNRCRS